MMNTELMQSLMGLRDRLSHIIAAQDAIFSTVFSSGASRFAAASQRCYEISGTSPVARNPFTAADKPFKAIHSFAAIGSGPTQKDQAGFDKADSHQNLERTLTPAQMDEAKERNSPEIPSFALPTTSTDGRDRTPTWRRRSSCGIRYISPRIPSTAPNYVLVLTDIVKRATELKKGKNYALKSPKSPGLSGRRQAGKSPQLTTKVGRTFRELERRGSREKEVGGPSTTAQVRTATGFRMQGSRNAPNIHWDVGSKFQELEELKEQNKQMADKHRLETTEQRVFHRIHSETERFTQPKVASGARRSVSLGKAHAITQPKMVFGLAPQPRSVPASPQRRVKSAAANIAARKSTTPPKSNQAAPRSPPHDPITKPPGGSPTLPAFKIASHSGVPPPQSQLHPIRGGQPVVASHLPPPPPKEVPPKRLASNSAVPPTRKRSTVASIPSSCTLRSSKEGVFHFDPAAAGGVPWNYGAPRKKSAAHSRPPLFPLGKKYSL